MNKNHGNNLLDEYYSQVTDVLTEDEKKRYDEYSFYEAYEVGLEFCNPCNLPIYCCACTLLTALISLCIPSSICGCNWVNTCCFGCSIFAECRTFLCSFGNGCCCVCDGLSNCCSNYHGDSGDNIVTGGNYCCDVLSGKTNGGDCSCSCDCTDGCDCNCGNSGGEEPPVGDIYFD